MRSYLILLVITLSSCGIFKKVHKQSTLDQSKQVSVSKLDSTGLTVDKSVTTVKEKADTNVKVPGKTVTQDVVFNMDSLVNGITAVKDGLVDVKMTLNPLTNKLTTTATVKPSTVPFKFDKETKIQNDITKSGSVSKNNEQNKEEKHTTDVIDKVPKNTFWYTVTMIGIAAVVCVLLYIVAKKIFKF